MTAIVAAPGFDEAELLRLAASVERASEHPLAVAIVRAAEERHLPTAPSRPSTLPRARGHWGPSKVRGSCSAIPRS